MNPDCLTVMLKYDVKDRFAIAPPDAEAKFILTQQVLKGWTTIHPMIPPKPAVLKFTIIGGIRGFLAEVVVDILC